LTRLNLPILNSCEVSASKHAVGRIEAIEDGEQFSGTRDVTPVPHQLTHDGEVGDHLHAGVAHADVGVLADLHGRSARGFVICPDAVTCFAEGEGAEGRA